MTMNFLSHDLIMVGSRFRKVSYMSRAGRCNQAVYAICTEKYLKNITMQRKFWAIPKNNTLLVVRVFYHTHLELLWIALTWFFRRTTIFKYIRHIYIIHISAIFLAKQTEHQHQLRDGVFINDASQHQRIYCSHNTCRFSPWDTTDNTFLSLIISL